MGRARMTDPRLPRNPADRVGTAGIERAAQKEIARRYRAARAQIMARMDQLGLTPDQADLLVQDVGAIMERWIADGTPRQFWYTDDFTAAAASKGATLAHVNLAGLSPEYAAARQSVEQILFSDAYLTRLRMARLADLEHFTGLAAGAKSDLAGVITRGIADGRGVQQVAREVSERLGVSMSRAKLYTQTQLPGALREARMAESQWAEDELGIKTALLWTSTLLPTTRHTHAARHGRAYTVAEVKEFYERDGNRYNCHCGQTEVLLDDNGKPMLSKRLRDDMQAEKQKWQQ